MHSIKDLLDTFNLNIAHFWQLLNCMTSQHVLHLDANQQVIYTQKYVLH
jgi:hypothetical protein